MGTTLPEIKPEYNEAMKIKLWILFFLFAILLSGCDGDPEPTPTLPVPSLKIYRDGYFQAAIPDWPESFERDSESIFSVAQDGQFISINRYQHIPGIFSNQFRSYIEEDPDAYLVQEGELVGKPFFEITLRENNQTMRLQAILDYCQGYTYAVITGGIDTVKNAELFQAVLESSSCQDPIQVPDLETGKIGMMVNPAQDDPLTGFYPALRMAKENGVQVVHTYLQWGEIEPAPGERFWEWQDFLMGYRIQEGFEISLVVNVIHTAVRGSIPEDLADKEFDDPEFIQRFTTFILDVLDRYPITYLSIGNEVNDYFVTHRYEIDSYQTFFLEVKRAIEEQHPDVKVGMIFAYHDAVTTNSVDIIKRLNLGDFLPLTLYIYNSEFRFNREPSELENYLDRILDLAGETPVAIVEIGWNTAESLEGNQADQAEFLQEAFRLLAQHRERIEFLSWFALHDHKPENSYESALSFIPNRSDLAEDEEFMSVFVDFLNYLGLREMDGTPKEAWRVFPEEI